MESLTYDLSNEKISFGDNFLENLDTTSCNLSIPPLKLPIVKVGKNYNDSVLFSSDVHGFIEDIFEDLVNVNAPIELINIIPRGLNNFNNKCFLNVTFQSLLYCPPFYQAIKKLSHSNVNPKEYPLLVKLIELFGNFKEASNKDDKLVFGSPFTPTCVYDIVGKFNPVDSGLQEDMQEFLLFILDSLHTELIKGDKRNQEKKKIIDDDDSEWEQVGKGGKKALLMNDRDNLEHTFVSDIFRGEMSNIVKKRGMKSTVTIEPFYCLHMDISSDNITSITDAISAYMTNERLSDFEMGTVEASRESGISKLPLVLLLHLKRFAFVNSKITKIRKHIAFDHTLKLHGSWYSGDYSSNKKKIYKLISVVTHIGNSVQGGHYTCDILQANGTWLRFDDSKVTRVSSDGVTQQNAYFLMYILSNE